MKSKRILINMLAFVLTILFLGYFIYFGVPFKTFLWIDLAFIAVVLLMLFIISFSITSKIRAGEDKIANLEDLDGALLFYDRKINSANSQEKFRQILLLDKARVLYLKGEFEEALSIMRDSEKYFAQQKDQLLQTLYYNNLLSLLLIAEKFDDVKALHESKAAKLHLTSKTNRTKKFERSIESTIASYNIFFGDAKKSKEKLLELLSVSESKLNRVETEYFIAIADLKLGNKAEAMARLEKIHEDCRPIYLYDKISKLLEN